jgi:hypothetical protein
MVNEFKREWILTHRDELQDRRSEVTPLDLGRIEFGELGESLLRVQTETLALTLLHQHAVTSPRLAARRSPLARLGRSAAMRPPWKCSSSEGARLLRGQPKTRASNSALCRWIDIPPDVRKMYSFSFLYPVSMTDTTPGIVNDVSAMLVATMTLRVFFGAVAKIFAWAAGGRDA